MKFHLRVVLMVLSLSCLMIPGVVRAGFDEGFAAYQNKDFATALREWEPLAAQGDASAQNNLGAMYANGLGVAQDYKEAVKWYRLAADQGYYGAQNNLGLSYDNGLGVAQDYKEAVKWYRLAADQGHVGAQFNLGLSYDNGLGVAQDYKEAVKWYRLAADQGYYGAQFNLGVSYANGQGVAQDYKEAVKWYRLAADQGNADAQNNLGVMYKRGQGVTSNQVIAYALYNLSATNDPSKENKAVANRAELAESMSVKEIEAAQTLTRDIAKPGNLPKALDAYARKPAVKEKTKPVAPRDASDAKPPSGDGYPERPAKRPGVVTCNTNCLNGDCRRIYDDGRKVRFQAQRKFNPLTSNWEFDSGGC